MVTQGANENVTHTYNGAKIIERPNARDWKRFDVLDPNGYHYAYTRDMEGAQAYVDAANKYGW